MRPSICLMLLLLIPVGMLTDSHAQMVSTTRVNVDVSRNDLDAGLNNTVVVSLRNVRTDDIYDLDIFLNLPAPLVLFGDNYWRFYVLPAGAKQDFTMVIFAPDAAAGNTYQAELTITYKKLGYIAPEQEMHTIGFITYGWTRLVAYNSELYPQPASPGEKITLDASLLNEGNGPALLTNVTAMPSSVLILNTESTAYVGRVEPKRTRSFSISMFIDSNAKDGYYPIDILISYQDDRLVTHSFTMKLDIKIAESTSGSSSSPLTSNLPVLAVPAVGIIVGWLYLRRRRRLGKKKA